MNRILNIALVLLLLTCLSCEAKVRKTKQGNCSYVGEPHLRPFVTPANPIQNQYVCHPSGLETLISNQFLEILVDTNPTGNYPIVKYTLTFFPTGSYPTSCIITDILSSPSTSLSCPPGSPGTVINTGTSWKFIHLTQDIQVEVYNSVRCFDIYIYQPLTLIPQSKGVCVNFACALEIAGVGRKKRQTQSDPTISKICDAFISCARQQAFGDIPQSVSDPAKIACQYDMTATLDQHFARSAVSLLIRYSIEQFSSADNFDDYWVKAGVASEQAICAADQQANAIIASSARICKDDGGVLVCLEPIDTTAECATG